MPLTQAGRAWGASPHRGTSVAVLDDTPVSEHPEVAMDKSANKINGGAAVQNFFFMGAGCSALQCGLDLQNFKFGLPSRKGDLHRLIVFVSQQALGNRRVDGNFSGGRVGFLSADQ